MMKPVLEIRNLRLELEEPLKGSKPIVSDINLKVHPGEVHALIGESGSGKTTIALSAMGYVRPGLTRAAGQVFLKGTDLFTLSPHALRDIRGNRVTYVAQSAAASFNPSLRIGHQVTETPREHALMSVAEAQAKASMLYQELRIPTPDKIAHRFPHEVSGGQLQRLMAAMAMISRPDLIIFDEPTTALDVTTQLSVLMAFRDLIKKHNTAAIYVSHDLALVAQIADRVTVLLNGEVKEEAEMSALIAAPKHEYSRVLMAAGTPSSDCPQAGQTETCGEIPLLRLESIYAGYGPVDANGQPAYPVIRDVNLSIEKGAVAGIIGESGSGKSTMAKVIAGLLPAARGEMLIKGTPLNPRVEDRNNEMVRRIQLVSQSADTALNPSHTIEKILGRPVEYFTGLKGSARRSRVRELLELVSLPPSVMDRRPSELSGGQKQRINLARALAAEPELILCDEVTSALDSIVRNSIVDLISQLREKLGLAILFISHDVSTVSRIADTVAVMHRGLIVESGPTGRVLVKPEHPYTRLLLNSVPRVEIGWLEKAYEKVQFEQSVLMSAKEVTSTLQG
ncbi:ABC transporter ATP-binding protein [Mesorhizobium australafricanum]|uniref:ABC transporter ATP-binding protein n=1 Tax=Mesorhizobium australafricanum TaxID=3072311 RepID=A0ABU4X9D3_9HYPH|nr:ABC transporter ATP-binding protein [Mesorhizobium sp. VK3E]MDX8443679.1 ABC transporter ATP-binding protein [Mesorhizobium sp. VK3E]